MHSVIDHAVIDQTEASELERAFFELQALRNVIVDSKNVVAAFDGALDESILANLTQAYKEALTLYESVWRAIRLNHFGSRYEAEQYGCDCEFHSRTVTISCAKETDDDAGIAS